MWFDAQEQVLIWAVWSSVKSEGSAKFDVLNSSERADLVAFPKAEMLTLFCNIRLTGLLVTWRMELSKGLKE